jgi:hypothetical protein
MIVQMAGVHAHVQRLLSVVKMAIVLEDCTTEEQRSVVRFCGQKDSAQRIFIKKCFLFTAVSVRLGKQFIIGSRNVAKVSRMRSLMWRCGNGRDNSRKTFMLWVSTQRYIDGTRVSVLVDNMSRNKGFSRLNITCFTFCINLWHMYWFSLVLSICTTLIHDITQ